MNPADNVKHRRDYTKVAPDVNEEGEHEPLTRNPNENLNP